MEESKTNSVIKCFKFNKNILYELKSIQDFKQYSTMTEAVKQSIHKEYRRIESEKWKHEQKLKNRKQN